ncbi:MAG: BMP family ABC transporter substrate-binding protein, partial [Chloroflexota bacterium]|nr:BMP family ABC transporter substrate-binding protein [Chloroflexota bacterium]
PTLRQLAEGKYDLIVVGTFTMIDALNAVAPEFPKQKFIFFDATVDHPNVANIVYAQNEGSFLAGALAGCVVSKTDMKGLTGDKVIGVVGGEDIPVINDFVVGYEQGAKYVDPNIEVLKTYNSGPQAYEDPAKGKELANALLEQGAGVVFNVAGKTGLGVLEAAAEANRYSIGVDANQNSLHPGSVLSSMLKRVDNSVFDLIQMEATGSLKTGKTYPYGIQNQGVGLAEDRYYKQYVPQVCQDMVEKAKRDIATGKVEVRTAFK